MNCRITRSSVVVILFVLAIRAAPLHAQDIGPSSFRDSLVMQQVARRAPCPASVPRTWTAMDSTLGTGLRCSLVEAAVRALEVQLAQRPSLRQRGDPRNPLCVRIVVRNNTGTTGLPGDWMVVMDLADDVPAYVMVDRQTGAVVLGIVGRTNAPSDMPSCVPRGEGNPTVGAG